MSDGRGISLRTKRKARLPISAPTERPSPIQQNVNAGRSKAGRPSLDASQRPAAGGKACI
jgi:hypothetical protein